MDPKLATEAAQQTFDAFRRDYLVASVVVLLLVNGVWAWAFSRVWRRLNEVQDARVTDHVASEMRSTQLANRMASHMDRATETGVHVLRAIDELLRVKGRKIPMETQPSIRSKEGP